MNELDPEQEQHLRALLADLGSTGDGADPLPADVAARLEETLGELVAQRETAQVTDPRRRWRPRLVAAAAAVTVLGLGGLTAADLSHSDHSSSSTATSSGSSGGAESQPLSGSATTKAAPGLPQLRVAGFARDVRSLLGRSPSLRARARVYGEKDDSAGTPAPANASGAAAGAACAGPPLTDGATSTPVSLDSKPAALVVHPTTGGKRLVEAWSCDGTHRLASTTVAP
jgi:hypothetical protein